MTSLSKTQKMSLSCTVMLAKEEQDVLSAHTYYSVASQTLPRMQLHTMVGKDLQMAVE